MKCRGRHRVRPPHPAGFAECRCGRPASCPPGAALASSRSSAPGGHAAARPPAVRRAPASYSACGGRSAATREVGAGAVSAGVAIGVPIPGGAAVRIPAAFAIRDLTQRSLLRPRVPLYAKPWRLVRPCDRHARTICRRRGSISERRRTRCASRSRRCRASPGPACRSAGGCSRSCRARNEPSRRCRRHRAGRRSRTGP
jgi:hypothetical protein